MHPELEIDKITPPPARLTGFLYHTPSVMPSLLLFLSTTMLLVLVVYTPLNRAEILVDFGIFAIITFTIPVILVSYLVSHISWSWDGRYPVRYGLQAGATGSLLMLITIIIGDYFDEPNKGLALWADYGILLYEHMVVHQPESHFHYPLFHLLSVFIIFGMVNSCPNFTLGYWLQSPSLLQVIFSFF